MKHTGRVTNTGRRCVVVFRQIYDDTGHVIDNNHCLVVETETLPDYVHDDFIKIVESEPAQSNSNLYDVLSRTRFSDGTIALQYLHEKDRLRKYPTNMINLIPNSKTQINLATVNKIISLQEQGYSEKDISRILESQPVSEIKDLPSSPVADKAEEHVLSDSDIAKNYISQADVMFQEAERLKNQAYSLDPSLKPKTTGRRKTTRTKAPEKQPAESQNGN